MRIFKHIHKPVCWTIATIIIFSILAPSSLYAQREIQTINDSWKFRKGECTAALDSTFKDDEWEDIHLPHTWNTDAYTEKDYYRGMGWYRRQIILPQDWIGKQVFLKLDAASKATCIYINGKKVGEHTGGYTASTLNITPFLSFNSPNMLVIRVDNARMDIPPISGDFTFFGGIYRDAWLIAVPSQHFNLTNHGSDGIFITTPRVSEQQATLSIHAEKRNDAREKTAYDLVCVNKGGRLINMDSQIPNKAALEWVKAGHLFPEKVQVPPEKTYGNSRFDLYVCSEKRKAFIEVKGVTLESDNIARFPDAPTERGVKHLKELIHCMQEGYEAYLLLVIQMKGVDRFEPNWETHREFGETLQEAKKAVVQNLTFDCLVDFDRI